MATLTIRPIRQDTDDPDLDDTELRFEIDSDGDVEFGIRWGDGPRQQRRYVILASNALELAEFLEQLT